MKNNKNLQLFLIPVLCGLAVLVAAIFAKNATVQKSMSVTETTTVACSSSNYSNRTSDSVCPSGYNNTGNNCTATPTYTYTCPDGGTYNSSIGKCEIVKCKQEATSFGGTCQCAPVDTGSGGVSGNWETVTVTGFSSRSCVSYCQSVGGGTYYAGGQGTLNAECAIGIPKGEYCQITPQTSCPSGWDPDDSTLYTATSTQTGTTYGGNITCAANTYTVVYNKNNTNATGTTANSTHVVGVAKTLTPNGYKLGGYIFGGWNTKADGTGTNYSDKQSVTNLSTTNGATVNLYAKWSACPAGKYAEAGATACSSCTGNTYTSSSGQSSCSSCPSGKIANSTHTGCVDEEAGTYTVKYNKNNTNATGTTADSIHTIDVAKTLTPNGYKLGGYIFGGWNTKADGTGTNYSDKQSVTNLSTTNGATVNLYAKWSTCPAGQYAEAGATACSPCVDETYTETPGQAACLICPEGQVANSDHTACVDGTPAKVSCPAGTYLKANGKTVEDCTTCPEGFYCPGGDYTPSPDDQGKEPCPEGHIDGGVGLSKEESCKIKCENGYYKDEVAATSCTPCPDDTTSISHYVDFGKVSDEGTCFSKEYKCYVCGENKDTYTWTNKYMGKDPTCTVDSSKNTSDKCKEDIVNPKTGLLEVSGILIGLTGMFGLAYYLIRKKNISNI